MFNLTPSLSVILICALVEVTLFLILRFITYRRDSFLYFDPSDFHLYGVNKTNIPKSSETATFEPVMKQYFDLAKVLVTIAGASIVFGGLDLSNVGVYQAKLFLAFSVACCLIFCLACLNFYETYTHDYTSYKPWKVSVVESFGVSGVLFFFTGYVWWAIHLNSTPIAPIHFLN